MDELEKKNANGIAGKPLEPRLDANGNVYETFQASNAIPEKPKASSVADSIKTLHNEGPIQNIRTYQSDVADVVKQKDISILKIAEAEQEKKANVKKTSDPKKNLYLLGLSSILFLIGALALGIFLVSYNKQPPAAQIPVAPPGIISVDSTINIAIAANQSLQQAFSEEMAKSATGDGSLTQFIFQEKTGSSTDTKAQSIDSQTFATLLNTSMPSWLIRSFNSDYMAGIENSATSSAPFIIFKTSSYENAFAGMLKWEPTMASDLAVLIGHPEINGGAQQNLMTYSPSTEATSTSSTTPTVTPTPALYGQFTDTVIDNKDVRELDDENGNPILMYALPDKETIVITTNRELLQELFTRLTVSKFVQ